MTNVSNRSVAGGILAGHVRPTGACDRAPMSIADAKYECPQTDDRFARVEVRIRATNTRLSERELAAILGHAEISAMFTSAPMLANVEAVRGGLPSLTAISARTAKAGASNRGR